MILHQDWCINSVSERYNTRNEGTGQTDNNNKYPKEKGGNQQSDKNENEYDRDIFSDMWEGNQTKNKLLQKKRNNKKGRKYFGASNPLAV